MSKPSASKSKIVLSYEITEEDYVAFNVYTYRRSKVATSLFWFFLGIIMIFGFTPYLFDNSIIPENEDAFYYIFIFLLMVALSALLAAGANMVIPFFQKYLIRSMIRKDRIDEYIGNYKLEVLDKGLRGTIHGTVSEVPYSRVRSIENDKRCLYVYIGGNAAYIIPFSAFKDEDDSQKFLDTIRGRLQDHQISEVRRSITRKKKLTHIVLGVLIWVALVLVFLIVSALFTDSPPDGIGHIREHALVDSSYLDGAEQISAVVEESSMEYSVHVELRIQKDQAERMIEDSVLTTCDDRRSPYATNAYVCDDPRWSMPDGTEIYPTSDQDALCTKSWPKLFSTGGASDDFNLEDTMILCVNTKTGELWYSLFQKGPFEK